MRLPEGIEDVFLECFRIFYWMLLSNGYQLVQGP